ncbi:MAG TPA: FtsX-like permease family protein [Acidimicrobiales bacterium]|nr:FtsX-like permease family protein [Acidimicrobiales bacterium]
MNFGEAVNFPLIFGVMLAIFGVATLIHLLLISLGRRRHEMGVLKAVGFLAGQVRAAVIWQAMTVVLIGVVVGAPLGIALGRAIWKAFAVNIGVVPVPIAPILPLAVLLVSVLGAAIVLATPTAVLASRAQPSEVLRSQ